MDNVRKAINEAMDEDNFNKRKEMEDDIVQAYLNEHINSDEYEALMDSEGRIEQGVTEYDTPEEFRRALELLGFDQKFADEMYTHELDHYNADIRDGLQPKFILQFYRLKTGQIGMVPSVRTAYSGEDEEKKRQQIKDSLAAPKNLSDSDKKKLGSE